MTPDQQERVTIVVLGEIGQSPRMVNHARALLERGAIVDIVAYASAQVTPAWMKQAPELRVIGLPDPFSSLRRQMPRTLFVPFATLRALVQAATLLWALLVTCPRQKLLLVQTPPALPTLAVVVITARLRRARLVIDWHNTSYSLLSLRLSKDHPLVRLVKACESRLGRLAHGHFCVSNAMAEFLESSFGLDRPITLYDRPIKPVSPPTAEQCRALVQRLGESLPAADAQALLDDRLGRPAVVVSASSWTADEDFSLLLDALVQWPATARPVLVVLTGRGPLRHQWETAFRSAVPSKVTIVTTWLSSEDYWSLLQVADLGICLHRSSSGLDLPMKIVDMYAMGLPVCAYDYGPCLRELVDPNDTGLLFTDAAQLFEQLQRLLSDDMELDTFRQALAGRRTEDWDHHWGRVAGPALGFPDN